MTLLSAPSDGRRRAAAVLLACALALHDLEEAMGYPLARPAIIDLWPQAPSVATARVALAVVTAAGVAAAAWAASGAASRSRIRVLRAIAVVLLANVLVPHVPAAIVMGGYAPGVLTALAVNLPACLFALRLLREA